MNSLSGHGGACARYNRKDDWVEDQKDRYKKEI
jgi:hypothetical protein